MPNRNQLILEATKAALKSVRHPRLFRTERGYAAMSYHFLIEGLVQRGLMSFDGDALLEMEYQKGSVRHDANQRPDLVFHIPVEVSAADVRENNYSTWSYKLWGGPYDAQDDFKKLDYMFGGLDYPLGFFIN